MSIDKKVNMKKTHYVNNAKFLEEFVNYKKSVKVALEEGKEKPIMPNYIGECFIKIAENLSHKPNFINYPHREEMIGDGIENCLMYCLNFDENKSDNPFAYFTQIIYYAFLRRILKEKKQLYVKYKSTESFGILDEHEMLEGEEGINRQFEMYENISEFIHNYEESRKKKKEPKPKGIEKFLE